MTIHSPYLKELLIGFLLVIGSSLLTYFGTKNNEDVAFKSNIKTVLEQIKSDIKEIKLNSKLLLTEEEFNIQIQLRDFRIERLENHLEDLKNK